MSKYKNLMISKGIMQKEILDNVRRIDQRVDKSLLSKIVNDVCLPTPKVLNCICNVAKCDVLDIYDIKEIDLLQNSNKNSALNAPNVVATARKDRGGLSHGKNVYNLTVEIPRDVATRVLCKDSLRKLGYLSKTDCVLQYIYKLDKMLQKILEKEKAVKGGQTHLNG